MDKLEAYIIQRLEKLEAEIAQKDSYIITLQAQIAREQEMKQLLKENLTIYGNRIEQKYGINTNVSDELIKYYEISPES